MLDLSLSKLFLIMSAEIKIGHLLLKITNLTARKALNLPMKLKMPKQILH